MGLISAMPGGSGLKVGGTAVDPGQSISTSQTKYAYPKLAQGVAGSSADWTKQGQAELFRFLQDPTSHPSYQASLQGVLASLEPATERGYEQLEDQFRQAGALESGAYGVGLGRYAGEVNRNQTIAASDVLKNIMPSIINGYSGPALQGPSLLEALKLSESKSASSQFAPNAGKGISFSTPNMPYGGNGGTSYHVGGY